MWITEIIDALASTTKINEKIDILKANKDNKIFRDILLYTYDDSIVLGIKDEKYFKCIGSNTGIKLETIWTDILRILELANNKSIPISAIKSNLMDRSSILNPEDVEVLKNIFKKDLRCGIGATLINKAFDEDFIYQFKIQLANVYKPDKNYKGVEEWFATPKFDGVRAFWTKAHPDILWTRNGKRHIGLDHIINKLNDISKAYPDIEFFDGELYTDNYNFNLITGNVMSKVDYNIEDKQRIKMQIFACGSDKFNNTSDMEEFIYKLSVDYNDSNAVEFILSVMVDNSYEDIIELAEIFVKNGYEGIMLRNPNTYYDFKRSDNLLKYKFFKENDFIITDITEGNGKYQNLMGNIVCTGNVDGHDIETECGTGFNDELRKYFWDNKEQLIGKKVNLKYQDISMNDNGKYSLRFPVFLRIESDR